LMSIPNLQIVSRPFPPKGKTFDFRKEKEVSSASARQKTARVLRLGRRGRCKKRRKRGTNQVPWVGRKDCPALLSGVREDSSTGKARGQRRLMQGWALTRSDRKKRRKKKNSRHDLEKERCPRKRLLSLDAAPGSKRIESSVLPGKGGEGGSSDLAAGKRGGGGGTIFVASRCHRGGRFTNVEFFVMWGGKRLLCRSACQERRGLRHLSNQERHV